MCQASVACVRVQAVQASHQKPPLSLPAIQSHNALLHPKISGQDYTELDRDILQLCGTHTCIHTWRHIYYWHYILMFATIKKMKQYDIVKVPFTESKIKLGSLLLKKLYFPLGNVCFEYVWQTNYIEKVGHFALYKGSWIPRRLNCSLEEDGERKWKGNDPTLYITSKV